MWIRNFFSKQTKNLHSKSVLKSIGNQTIIEQDNTSAIQLERNGWRSSSKHTKHINVWYFYITDRLQNGEITKIVHKPTEDMEADFLTKALQGHKFYAHRNTLMGLSGIDEYMFYNKYKTQQSSNNDI